jgi:glycosyltransferase involved in cell wall biosynthesis
VKLICPRVKVIHTFHGLTDNYQSKVKKFLSLIFTRLFKVLTDRFILVSKGELNIAKKLKAVNKNRVHIIYNGIEKPSCTERFNSATFDIVTLSRFDYQKNMDLAYKIACRFKRNRHIRFIWVGDGGDFDRLKQKSKDEDINIIFTGFSTTPFVHLLSSSVYLSTARFEGLPYALIEAISVGLPIIATDVTGNNEIVINNHNGYLFNTVDEAVESINKLYHNRERLSEMSIQSKKLFKAKFTIESMIGELVLVYNELIKTS